MARPLTPTFTPRYLNTISKRFDQTLRFDGGRREDCVRVIDAHCEDASVVYSEEEEETIDKSMASFERFNGEHPKTLKTASPLTQAKIVYEKGQSTSFGWSRTVVRGNYRDVLAYVWDSESRNKLRKDDVEKSVDEHCNAHNQVV